MKKRRMISAAKRENIIENISSVLRAKEDIRFAYVFGSFASGGSFNDIDIGVFVTGENPASFLDLELKMEGEIGEILHVPVDVRIVNSTPLPLTYNIIKSGTVILDNDRTLRADFEGLILKKYFDYKHLRDEYLREVAGARI